MNINDQVRSYWEDEACGTNEKFIGDIPQFTHDWYEQIERHRYTVEPFIHSVAQFTRFHGKSVLEVGVGAGTDHLQWARAGAICYGVDLTDTAIETTSKRLQHYGFTSELQQTNAEKLPFPDDMFDVVYSWGVIHHTDNPQAIINEIFRVLKKDGVFIGMMYHRRSLVGFKLWLRYALLVGRPWRTLAKVIWDHMESVGTKAYSCRELEKMFNQFKLIDVSPILTPYDGERLPRWLFKFFPDSWGWFIPIRAIK